MNDIRELTPFWAEKHLLKEKIKKYSGSPEFSISHLPKLNKTLFGLDREELVVVGARPSEGKSALCLDIAYELSLKNKVLFLSMEMTKKEAQFRIMCKETKIPNTIFYEGKHLTDATYKYKISEYLKKLSLEKRNLIVTEQRGKTWKDLFTVIDDLGDNIPDIIVLDYVQKITTTGMRRDAFDEYIKQARRLAIDKKLCFVMCSQIGRANIADSKEPTMEGLKETGSLEEHADKVLLLHYPCKRNAETDTKHFKVIVAKNKNGMTGFVKMNFNAPIYSFTEMGGETLSELMERKKQ